MKKLKELRAKIDEVSTGYLNRYVGLSVDKKGKLQKSGAAGSLEKAAKASTDAVRSGDKEAKRAATKTVNKRAKGLQMARAKLDKKAKVPATEAAKYPHMMYDPKTGKEVTAKTPADHNKYAKMGYTHEKPTNEAIQYKVDVEGLPPTFMTGKSPAEIMAKLRKIVKQPSMIKSVERHTDAEVKKAFRNKAQGREMNEAVDTTDTGGAEEVSMAMGQVKAMRHYLDGIEERVQAEGDMEEWFQNKLTKANDYLKTLYGYGKGKTNEAVIYHGNPNKDDDARNAARRKGLAKRLATADKKAYKKTNTKNAPTNEASVVPSKDGKKLVPMKKHSEPKEKPVPNSQFGLPRLQKTNEAVYGSQAQRMMSPLQKARQDKEKTDRDRHGKLHMMKGRPKKLGEISMDLKQRYADKAKSDYGHQQFTADIAKEMGAKDAEKHYRRKQRNRMAGITRAKK